MTRRLLSQCGIAALLFIGLLWTGCDNTFDPVAERSQSFSVYGFLNLSDDKHFVRVKDTERPVPADTTRKLDVTVSLQNQSTGETMTLQDSVVEFDGIYTHNFWLEKDIQPKSEYRLTVEGGNGTYVDATARLPPQTDVKVTPPVARCTETIQVAFPNMSDVTRIQAEVGFRWEGQWHWTALPIPSPSSDIETSFIPEIPEPEEDEAGVIERLINDPALYEVDNHCALLDDGKFYVAYTHLGPDWPTQSPVVNPLETESVDGGLGAFGGLHRDTLTVPVDIVDAE